MSQGKQLRYSYMKTGLTSNQFPTILDNHLYYFDGIGFYKRELSSGNTTLLYSGDLLPKPSHITWVKDTGVLLSFNSSFSPSRVESELRSRSLPINSKTKKYTWFLNFSKNSLDIVDTEPVLNNQFAISSNQGKIYYSRSGGTSDTTHGHGSKEFVLYEYDLVSKSVRSITSDQLINITYVGICDYQTDSVCVAGTDPSQNITRSLIRFNLDNNSTDLLLKSTSRIYPTSNPSTFLLIDHTQDDFEHKHDIEDYDYVAEEAYFYNSTNNSKLNLGVKLSGTKFVTHFTDANNFYIIGDVTSSSDGKSRIDYKTGAIENKKISIKNIPLSSISTNEYLLNDTLLGISHHSEDKTLINTLSSDFVLILRNGTQVSLGKLSDERDIRSAIEDCLKNLTADIEYSMEEKIITLYIPEDKLNGTKFNEASSCLAEKRKGLLNNYTFSVLVKDSASGRLISS